MYISAESLILTKMNKEVFFLFYVDWVLMISKIEGSCAAFDNLSESFYMYILILHVNFDDDISRSVFLF